MSEKSVIKGVLLVGLGATSYGMLATFVKLAYADKGITGNAFTPAEVISAQFILGIIAISFIILAQRRQTSKSAAATNRNITMLMLTGTSTGLTSIFYYLAVKYIPVSIGIVLLMQTVWMGVLLEWVLEKRMPSQVKAAAVIIVLIGTALATNLLNTETSLDWRGIVLGLLAAASFTTTMFASNRVAVAVSAAWRSLYMLLGGAAVVLVFAILTQSTPFNYDIFYKWGIIIALFGTVIPPMLMNAGFPLTGIGLGSIVSALELPVSVMMAWLILNEKVAGVQWLGIALIIFAIVMMNVDLKRITSRA